MGGVELLIEGFHFLEAGESVLEIQEFLEISSQLYIEIGH